MMSVFTNKTDTLHVRIMHVCMKCVKYLKIMYIFMHAYALLSLYMLQHYQPTFLCMNCMYEYYYEVLYACMYEYVCTVSLYVYMYV